MAEGRKVAIPPWMKEKENLNAVKAQTLSHPGAQTLYAEQAKGYLARVCRPACFPVFMAFIAPDRGGGVLCLAGTSADLYPGPGSHPAASARTGNSPALCAIWLAHEHCCRT